MDKNINIWLVQRSEVTPIDKGDNRLLRTGLIADIIANDGHNVTLWTSDFNHFNHSHRFNQNHLSKIKKNYSIQFLKSLGYKSNFSIRRYLDDIYVANQFEKVSKNLPHPDIIMVSMPSIEITSKVVKYSKKNDIPVYVEIRDLWPDIFLDISPLIFKPIIFFVNLYLNIKLKKSLKNADGLIGITESYLKWALNKIKRRKTKNDSVYQMGYLKQNENDLLNYKKLESNTFSFINKSNINVVFVGTIGKTNDLETVLISAKKIANKKLSISFIIAGKGEKYFYLKKKYSYLQNVVFVGWLDRSEIRVLLSKCHIGILPYINSNNYKFNIPNKPSEYLSEGLALALSLDQGEMYQLIQENNIGFSYGNSSNLLIKKLEKLTLDKSKLFEYKKKSLKVFDESFDAQKIYNKLIHFLKERTK